MPLSTPFPCICDCSMFLNQNSIQSYLKKRYMKLDCKCEQSPNASGLRRGTSGAGSQAHAGSLLGLRAAKGLSMVGSTCLPISSPKLKNTISITECITTMEKLAYQKKWKYTAKFMLQYVNLIIVSEEFISDGFFFVSCLSFTFSHMTTYILIPFFSDGKKFFSMACVHYRTFRKLECFQENKN